ncbi:MAG: hypothetical protein RLZZ15_2594 [Verrucomicrobiota bacterium]|jgi:lysophospholipase L1-like esterase
MNRPTLAVLLTVAGLAAVAGSLWNRYAIQPMARSDKESLLVHERLLGDARRGHIDLYFVGDSITSRWIREARGNWHRNFGGWAAANFGRGGDKIPHVLWRLRHGELDGVHPKVIVVLAGANDLGDAPPNALMRAVIRRRLESILATCHEKAPAATIILTAIFPRGDNPAAVHAINRLNEDLARLADGKTIRFLNVNAQLADANGVQFPGLFVDTLHLGLPGYQVWADGLKPALTELLGPPAAIDRAPPPTSDPSAKKK